MINCPVPVVPQPRSRCYGALVTDAAAYLSSHDDAVAAAHRVAQTLAPGVIERDRAGASVVPRDVLAVLDGSGLLGITVPADHGGPGLGPRTLAEVTRILASVDPAIAQVPQGHFLVVDILAVWGGAAARKRLFAEVLAGRRIGNALAERGGRHAQDLTTRLAADDSGRLRLDGRKYYCTGALTAAWVAVSALNDEGRLTLVVVPRDAAGLDVDQDWNTMGQRATISGTTTLDAVAVDPDLVLDYAAAYAVPQQLGARAQLVHAAIEAGIAGGALRDTRSYLRDRARPSTEAVRAGADSAAGDPHVLHRYGRLATRVRAAKHSWPTRRRSWRTWGSCRSTPPLPRPDPWPSRARRHSPARWPWRRAASCSRSAVPARPTNGGTCTGTGATPVPTACTIPWTGSTTTSARTRSVTPCRRTTVSCSRPTDTCSCRSRLGRCGRRSELVEPGVVSAVPLWRYMGPRAAGSPLGSSTGNGETSRKKD